MADKNKNFTIQRVLLLFIEFAFITMGFGNTIYQIVTNFNSKYIVSGINNVLTLIYFICYLALIYYCIWGYKRKYTPYRVALSLYLMSLTVSLVRLLVDFEPGKLSIFFSATAFLILISIALVMVFDNTFKDHKTTAKIIGAIIIVLEMLTAFSTYFIIKESGIVDIDDILAFQPFARFFIISTLYTAFITRTHWREHEKIENK